MKYYLLMLFYFSTTSFANNSISNLICNAYTVEADKAKCFKELNESPKKKATINDKPVKPTDSLIYKHIKDQYLVFKYGGSACERKTTWHEFVDISNQKGQAEKALKLLDESCYWLNEGQVVYGFLDSYIYEGVEYAKVRSSEGLYLWLELSGILPIVSQTELKPIQWKTVLQPKYNKSKLTYKTKDNNVQANAVLQKNGTVTNGLGVACLSEYWYDEILSSPELLPKYVENKWCVIPKKGMKVNVLDSSFFTGRVQFTFRGAKFWSNRAYLDFQ